MEKMSGIIVEKNGQERIDFNSAVLDKAMEEINKENNFFKLSPGDVLYDGENYIVDHTKMTLDQLKKQVRELDSIKRKEFLEELEKNRELKHEEEAEYKRRWWDR